MAAVLALIFIPVLAAVSLMVVSNLGESPSATVATLLFAVLAFGVFASILKMARRWEEEAP